MNNTGILNVLLRTIHRFLIMATAFAGLCMDVHAQCTGYPVRQAVIDGDFERSFDKFAGPPSWFELDGYYPVAEVRDNNCYYGTLNAYWVGNSNYNFSCQGSSYRQFPFCPGCFELTHDHTFGSRRGNYLAVDTWSDDNGPGTRISDTGTDPVVWRQRVGVFPGEKYYFSAWVANWHAESPAQLRFFVQWLDDEGNHIGDSLELGDQPFSVSNTNQWEQFYETTQSPANADSAMLTIRNQNEIVNGNDFALDDISFINGCDNIYEGPEPDLGADRNLCRNGGAVLLNSGLSGEEGRFTWFKRKTGTAEDSVIAGPAADLSTLDVDEPGNYRVCFKNEEGCTISDRIQVYDTLNIDLPDITNCRQLADGFHLDLDLSGNAISSIQWRGPSGDTNDVTYYKADSVGMHNLNITSGSQYHCDVSDAFKVSARLPFPGESGYAYCMDGERREPQIKVYPNPNDGKFTLTLKYFFERSVTIHVVSTLGVTVYQEKVKLQEGYWQGNIDLKYKASAMYYLRVKTGGYYLTEKVIKANSDRPDFYR